MKEHITLRRGKRDEIDEIIGLTLRSYGTHRSVITPDNWAIMEQNIRNRNNMVELFNASACWVCESAGAIAGMVFFVPGGFENDMYPSSWAYIRLLGVSPEHRKQGIGRLLTEKCLELARSGGEKTIGLHTSEIMVTAWKIYTDLGFEMVKELPPRFGLRYWLFKKEL